MEVRVDDASACIPESLRMFLNLLYGGQEVLGDMEYKDNDDLIKLKVISMAHDIIYNLSKRKIWTSKHIELTSTLRQATRSKDLVNLFHRAGHCLSYKQTLQLDTALANKYLVSIDDTTSAVMPYNFIPDNFFHFFSYNIDILDESLDGKNTFHATQMTAYQRGDSSQYGLMEGLKIYSKTTLDVPQIIGEPFPVKVLLENKPPFQHPATLHNFKMKGEDTAERKRSVALDQTFFYTSPLFRREAKLDRLQ